MAKPALLDFKQINLNLKGPLEYFGPLDFVRYQQKGNNSMLLCSGVVNNLSLWRTADGKYLVAYPKELDIAALTNEHFEIGCVFEIAYRKLDKPDELKVHDYTVGTPIYMSRNRILILPADLNIDGEITT